MEGEGMYMQYQNSIIIYLFFKSSKIKFGRGQFLLICKFQKNAYTCIYFNHVTRLSLFDTYIGRLVYRAMQVKYVDFTRVVILKKYIQNILELCKKTKTKNTSSLIVYNKVESLPLCTQRNIRRYIVKKNYKIQLMYAFINDREGKISSVA